MERETSNNQYIYLSPPHMSGKEQAFVQDAFATNWIAPLGPHVTAFEQEVAEYIGVKGAVALSSGTAAIHLGLRLLGVGPGDQVFCSDLTFVASINPVLYLGAEPVFIDSEPTTWNMSPLALKYAFQDAARRGKLPKAVVVVDLYGQSADMKLISDICQQYEVPVLEDSAEALGASYQGVKCGAWGEYGVFSFNGNKIITTSGGGMLLSNNTEALKKALFWATQARDPVPYYQHSEMGYNYRMSNVLAAIGRGQMQVLEQRVESRRAIFARYQEKLADIPGLEFMPEFESGRSNRWLTVLLLNEDICGLTPRDLKMYLDQESIESRPVWKPMHLQPLFRDFDYYTSDNSSFSELVFRQGICIPSGSNLSASEQQRVIDCMLRSLKN